MTASADGTLGARALDFVFGDVDAVRFDSFRRTLALSFGAYMLFRLSTWREWLTDFGYHLTASTATCTKPLPVPTLPAWLVPLFAVAVVGSALALVLGFRPRTAAWVATAGAVYAQLVDEVSSYSLNKMYVTLFFLCALAPRTRLGASGRTVQSAWPLRVVQATLLIVYATAGLCKIVHGEWTSAPDVLFEQLQGSYRTSFAAWLLRSFPLALLSTMQMATLAFELLAPILFSVRRLRPLALVAGLCFHLFVALTMHNLFYFSFQVVSLYVAFIEPATLRSLYARLTSLHANRATH